MKSTFYLPDKLHKHLAKKADESAKRTGRRPSVSREMQELILADMAKTIQPAAR